MNTQGPFGATPQPPDASLLTNLLQFKISRFAPPPAYYTTLPCAPQLYHSPLMQFPQLLYVDNQATHPLPNPHLPTTILSPPDLSAPRNVADASPIVVVPRVPLPMSESSDSIELPRKSGKRIHKQSKDIYKCTKCERTYLSYPALYTHVKLKHPIIQEQNVAGKTNRGRPRKTVNEKRILFRSLRMRKYQRGLKLRIKRAGLQSRCMDSKMRLILCTKLRTNMDVSTKNIRSMWSL